METGGIMDKTTFPKTKPLTGYHETKKHSDSMFAYNVYPCTIPLDFTFVPLHWQDSAEIIYIKKGRGLVLVDFETYQAASGDIFIIMPEQLHGLRQIAGESMEYENIIFDLNFLENNTYDLCFQKYWQPLIQKQISFPVHIPNGHKLHRSLQSYLDASDSLCDQRPVGYELAVKGNLMLIFAQLFQMQSANGTLDDKNIQKLKFVFGMIEESYQQKLTISEIADKCGYSESHFMRWFKNMTGSSFGTYLIDYRLEKAAALLKNSPLTVLDIAVQSGFDNISNFNRLFKKRFGLTPNQFRKTNFRC